MKSCRQWARVFSLGLAMGCLLGCDLIEPVVTNPNTVPEASPDQLLVGTTLGAWSTVLGTSVRAIWLQHLDGIDRQAAARSRYEYTETDVDEYSWAYAGGGLVDIRKGIALAEAEERRTYAGIFKVLEALQMGTVAAEYGDVAYSQAVNPEFPTPVLDPQQDVYEAVQFLLDEAISDLQSGQGLPPGSADMVYAGDVSAWTAAAYSLKARYHLHWAEVEGLDRYAAALTAANQGIRHASGDFMTIQSDDPEERAWGSNTSPDILVAGEFLVEELKSRADPRLNLYFGEGTGSFAGQTVGSPPGSSQPGDPGEDSSELACKLGLTSPAACPLGRGYGSYDWNFPILTCAETYLVIAEAESQLGSEAGAKTALDAALQCEETRKGVDLSETRALVAELSGEALLSEIMMQKYFSLFLNPEVWNDYKRTCIPALPTYNGLELPGRFLYPFWARSSNPNIPIPGEQPDRNANDPDPCPSVGG